MQLVDSTGGYLLKTAVRPRNFGLVKAPGRRTRRRYDGEFKKSVIEACRQPGISIAAVALANGLNANMLRKWVIDADARHGVGVEFEQSLESVKQRVR